MQVDSTYKDNFLLTLSSASKSLYVLFTLFIIITLVAVTSASSSDLFKAISEGGMNPVLKHIIIVVWALIAFFGLQIIPKEWLRQQAPLFLAVALLLVLALPFFGTEINDAKRWISLGFFNIQPSEFFKLAIVVCGAIAGAKAHKTPNKAKTYFLFYMGYSIFGIGVLLTDNMSTALMFGVFMWGFALIMHAPWRLMATTLAIGLFLATIGTAALLTLPTDVLTKVYDRAPTWRNRILNMSDGNTENEYEINDKNRQEKYGYIAVSNSRLIGQGIGQSKMKDVLPMANSDFIYAVIIEEYGVFGMLFIPALFVWWMFVCWKLARREQKRYYKYLLLGLGILFPMQALVNMCVVAGFFMTGQTLPFISWGGSSLLASYIAMGIVVRISSLQNQLVHIKARAEREGFNLTEKSDE